MIGRRTLEQRLFSRTDRCQLTMSMRVRYDSAWMPCRGPATANTYLSFRICFQRYFLKLPAEMLTTKPSAAAPGSKTMIGLTVMGSAG